MREPDFGAVFHSGLFDRAIDSSVEIANTAKQYLKITIEFIMRSKMKLKATPSALLVAMTLLGSGSAVAETVTASFTAPDGGVTSGLYSGIVHVTVSGFGQSLADDLNDAFYLYSPVSIWNPPFHDAFGYYQLAFGTSALVPNDASQAASNFIVGGLPAYNPSHVYSFDLDTGSVELGQLHFGVSDGIFADNAGAFTIEISAAIPEPSTWAMLILGFTGVGLMAYRRRNQTAALAVRSN
jgi:PEP-CTERM motif